MSIKQLDKRDLKVIEGLNKTLNSDIFELYKKFKDDEKLSLLVSTLYNLKDLFDNVTIFDYYIGATGTIKAIDKILDRLSVDEDTKDNFSTCISTIASLNKKKFDNATQEEMDEAKNLYVSHLQNFVIKGGKYGYRNKFKPSKALLKITRKLKDESKNIVSQNEVILSKEKASIICDEYQYVNNSEFKTLYTTGANDYFSVFSFENELNVDLKIYPDGTIYIGKGKVALGDSVELKQGASSVAPGAAEIEQPQAKQAASKPVATPTPPPADPEPEQPAEEADDIEQDLIDGVDDEENN